MPERALIGALKRTRVSSDDSPSASSPSARPSESKQPKRSVTFGEKHTLGTADAAVDRTPHGEPPRCGGCGLHCLGRLYACKTCERRVSMESLEVGPAFHERVSRAFNLCTVCFSAHVRVSFGAGFENALSSADAAKAEKSDVRRDVDVILTNVRAVEAERSVCVETHADSEKDSGDEDVEHERVPRSSRGRDALAMLHKDDDDELTSVSDANGDASNETVGVHEHSPFDFVRRNDADQAMLETMAEEKKRFKLERGESCDDRSELWVDSGDEEEDDDDDDDLTPRSSDENGVSVGEVAFDAPASVLKKKSDVWDYASELI
jgi:hypothetical protein